MSYCRFGPNSDVYVINGNECCACGLNYKKSMYFHSRRELIDHLVEHLEKGEKVPFYAIIRLLDEIKRLSKL